MEHDTEGRNAAQPRQAWTVPPRAVTAIVVWGVLMAWPPASVGGAIAAAEDVKIGYVNLAQIFDEYQRTKESEQHLERRSKEEQREVEQRAGELQKLRQRFELLSDQVRESKFQELEEKSDAFQRLKKRAERSLLRDRNRLAKDILEEIDHAVREYAQTHDFTLILNQRSVVYVQSSTDVTSEVLEILNTQYARRGKR